MKQLSGNVLVLLAVLFHTQMCSARWLDRLAFASHSFVPSANGRANVGRCIDFAPETANGQSARAGLWTCHAPADSFVENQHFGIWLSDDPIYFGDDPWYEITISKEHNGVRYCLDVKEGRAIPGAALHFWKCHGGLEQRFLWSWSQNMLIYNYDRSSCITINDADSNGADVIIWPCDFNNAKYRFRMGPLDSYGAPLISNGLPELNHRCSRRDGYCTFECPKLTRNGPQAEYWLDGTRLACSLNDKNRLSCVTAVPLHGPTTVDGGCGCECEWYDPGHKGLMPSQSKQRFPVPQLRTSPDMPEVLRKAPAANAMIVK
ncbi:hypothetical protein GGF31_006925 [Allomyces arbusculus]|nr:hypothetical protein GGF31_006925 [Allomyces arbusculus]